MEDGPGSAPPSQEDPARPFGLLRFLATFFVLLALYILSPAPLLKLFGQPLPPTIEAAANVIYSPLGYVSGHVPAVRSFYQWYCRLWGVPL